jgi:hypothetical protein
VLKAGDSVVPLATHTLVRSREVSEAHDALAWGKMSTAGNRSRVPRKVYGQ